MGDIAPCLTITQTSPPFRETDKLASFIRGFDNAYFNVFPFGVDTVAIGDQSRGYLINPETLETMETYTPYVPGGVPGSLINH